MTTPRRRMLRPPQTSAEESRRQQKLLRRREPLRKEHRPSPADKQTQRAFFHAMKKQQHRVARLEPEAAPFQQV